MFDKKISAEVPVPTKKHKKRSGWCRKNYTFPGWSLGTRGNQAGAWDREVTRLEPGIER
ncbi:hypothetical protein [Desulfonatronospira sp.]|uniref:hypothetical protein n=1 Tax=Desulfonatronospira sp. TaxID=1962951 RepID=UPI0025B9D15B|nr:hypothetical protein [Desulfonatronospira sp.]